MNSSESPNEEVAIAVEQTASDSSATGFFQFIHEDEGIELEADEIGQLQAKEGWASFTGQGTLENDEERTLVFPLFQLLNPFIGHIFFG